MELVTNQTTDQKATFWKIIRAALLNVLGFGAATLAVIYLNDLLGMDVVFIVASIIIAIIVLISVSGLLVFIFYTIKSIPDTKRHKPEDISWGSLYGYTVAALLIRCVEGALCVYFMLLLYQSFQ